MSENKETKEIKISYESIWEDLSKVDCSEHIKEIKYGNRALRYLSWSWAWGILMEHYPQATYRFYEQADSGIPYIQFPNGTAEVRCRVTIGRCSREMWLAVMDKSNSAVKNPTSTQINDSKMRCLTKCLAMFGLGHYIYAGEDLPTGADEVSTDNVKDTKQEVQKNDEDVLENGMSRASDIGWANTFVKGFKNLVKTHKTRESVQNYYKSNGKSIKRLESINPDMLADIDNYCKEYIATLEEKNDG